MVGSFGVADAEAVALLHLAESLDRQGRSDEAVVPAERCAALAGELGMDLLLQDLDRMGLATD